MRVGYARVSTQDQTLALQLDALRAAECERIFEEHASGKNANRPQLKSCLAILRKGDVLVVWRLDRLGRSIKDLAVMVSDLQELGVKFVSLKENIDTSSAAGTMQFAVFAGMAQAERELMQERTNAGLKAARARGRLGGRPSKTTSAQRRAILTLHKDPKLSIGDIAKQFRVSRTTVHRIVQQGNTFDKA